MSPSTGPLVSYAQNREDLYLWALLGHREAGTYVDVGCNEERSHSVTRLFYEHGWSGLNIDANPAFEAQYERRTRDRFVLSGVGAEQGEATFRIYPDFGGHSTFDPELQSMYETVGYVHDDVTIPVRTLNDILAEAGVSAVDFLKIDVEGVEPDVLRGLDLDTIRPSIIVLEASRIEACEAILFASRYRREFFDGLNLYYADDDVDDVNILNYAGRILGDGFRTDLEQMLYDEVAALRAHATEIEAELTVAPSPETPAATDPSPRSTVQRLMVAASSPRHTLRRLRDLLGRLRRR